MKSTLLPLSLALMTLAGCASVTVQPKPIAKLTGEPTFSERKNFFMWGLVGEEHVDVTQICSGEVKQMQSQQTFADGFLGLITLGIYAPHTVKVWCE